MEGDEGGISSEASNWKSLFLQSPRCPSKEYDAIFRHIHQKIRVYPRSKKKKKKSALISGWENIIAYWKEYKQSKALVNKLGFF